MGPFSNTELGVTFVSDRVNQVLAELESRKGKAEKRKSQLEDDFVNLAAKHRFAVITPPHADANETGVASHMKVGWLATSFAGVVTLAGLSTISLSDGLPQGMFFFLSAGAGWLLRVIFDKAVLATLPADPQHPESMKRVRTILILSSLAVASSFGSFCWLRFSEDRMALSLISPIALVFEGGLFAMAAAFHAGEVINGWSRQMVSEYEGVSTEYDQIQRLIRTYEHQLEGSLSRIDQDATSKGGHNEIDISRSDRVGDHHLVVANKPNGREGVV